MYLHQLEYEEDFQNLFREIAKKYELLLRDVFQKRLPDSNLAYVIPVFLRTGKDYMGNPALLGDFYISEFPGNCSLFVVSNIEYYFTTVDDRAKKIFEFAKEVMEKFKYAGFIISGTRNDVKDILVTKFGFKIILEGLFNPHSGKVNWFALYQPQKKEE